MKKFSISDLERFSGIKAHTIRTWEQRYGIPKPQRSKTNLRYYTLDDVVSVLKLTILNQNGYRISQLAAFSADQIEEKLKKLSSQQERLDMIFIDLLHEMYSLDVEKFDEVLDNAFLCWPIDTVIHKVIYPFLKKTELLNEGNRLDEEHLVVTSIRRKMLWAIEKIDAPLKRDKTVLLFLPDTYQLDLALLYTYYALKSAGIKVLYLGNNVSQNNLNSMFEKFRPQFVYTYLPKRHKFPYNDVAKQLSSSLQNSKLILTSPSGANGNGQGNNTLHLSHEDANRMLLV